MRSYKGRLLHLFYMMFLILHWNKSSSHPSRKENDNDLLQPKPSSESGIPSFSDILGKKYGHHPATERQSVASTRGQTKEMFQYPFTEPCSKALVGDSYEYESSDQSKSHVKVRRHSKKQGKVNKFNRITNVTEMNTPQCTYNDPYRRGQARKFSNEIKAAITISKYSENYKLYSRKSGTLVADNDNLNPDYRYNKTYQIYSRRGRTLMAETDNRYSDFKYNKTYQIYSRRGRTLMAENDNRNPDFRYNKTYQIYSRRGRTLMAENDNRNPDFRYNKTYQSYSHRGRTLMSENDNRNPDFKYNKTYQIYSRRGRTLMAENDNWSPDFKYNKTYQIYSRRGRALMAENEEWSPDVHHFTMLANTQCPYADFCLTNASQSLPPGKMSCCKSCHCDYECGHRIDCCIDVIDTFNIVETEGLVCVAPRIGYAETDPKTLPNYNMIDRCLLNNTHDCKNVSTALWGALYPVYSPSRDLIFFNKECAICSDVQDYLNWNTYLSCLHPSVNIDEMIIDLAEGRCKLDFYPPEGAIVDKYICYNTVVDSCNITGYWLEYDPFVEAACRIIHAPISGYGYNFANIFCKLCNGFRHNPLATCDPAHGKRFSHWITYLLDYRVASPHVSEKESEQSSLGNERCDMFSIQHPYKDECREMLCPNGAIKTPDGCKQFTINWDNARYILSVLLTPLNKWIPLQQFANLRGNLNQNYKKTFKSNGIPLDTFKLYINATEKGNVSFVETLHLILGDKHFSGKMKEVLDLIRSAMSKTWNIRLDKLYVFDAAFGKTLHIYGIEYETYIDNQPNASSKTQQLVYFKEFQRSYKSGLYLNKLYFCKQVELLPGEWIKLDRDEVQLNLTEGNGKILGDAEYIYTGDDLERMRICVDDFNPVYSDEHVVVSNGNKLAVVGNSAIQIMLCVVHVFMKINQ